MIKRRNEAQILARGRHIDIGPRLGGLGLQRELEPVSSIDVVFAKIVHRFPQSLDRLIGATTSIGFDALTATPKDKYLRAQFCADIHGSHGFLKRISTYFRIVGGEGSITKYRMEKERDRCHGNHNAIGVAGFLECADDGVALG